ncbi:hypothetical protein N7478_000102 [Penicillium angulare]|uniref:uncharacterized protein n=1 Tax=Penicillium angulare TaxID=116970 RepID=UPI0025400CA8|nr:uncharacterized protein N7478_000102 [Penicillium angulare]KAJ5290851.1 hypothetical protein N7478_000102 [Penicillium angulare]
MHQVRRSVVHPCRLIARRRYPVPAPSRRFHISPQCRSAPPHDPHDDPSISPDTSENHHSPKTEDITPRNEIPLASVDKAGRPASRPYGSALRRAMRSRQSEDPQNQKQQEASAKIPDWFSEQNMVTRSPEGAIQIQQVVITKSKPVPDLPKPETKETMATGGGEDPSSPGEEPSEQHKYAVPEELWGELRASVKSGLRLPPAQYAAEPAAKKSHLVLQYPGYDGIPFLDAVVRQLSSDLKTDLITLSAQDIAQLFSEQDLTETGSTSAIRSLGYEVHRPPVTTWPDSGEGEVEGDDDFADIAGASHGRTEVSTPRFITIESGKEPGDVPLPNWLGLKSLVASINGQGDQEPGPRHLGQRAEQRWTRLLNEVISSLGCAPEQTPKEAENSPETDPPVPVLPRDTIIHIQDYREIQSTREGSRVITLLQKIIQERRKAGSRIVFIGSTSQELRHAPSQDGSKILQNVFDDNFSKTLVVTPSMDAKAAEKKFSQDQKIRIMDINIRHLQTMLRFRLHEATGTAKDDIFGNRAWPLDSSTIKHSGIKERFWSYNQVHWVATLALGSVEPGETFGFEHIRRGIDLMEKGDQITNDWLQEKTPKTTTDSNAGQSREQLLSSLRKTCTTHEKKLLNGVVDAKSIRTTFNDVHVPPETIDALKTLTSLSLIRPEAFTYGVLATDKIPGLLLYGPPGTGKTLLAKAVARESGATVLEVSGSEVYDMYVGEGEKNVKAIFTLAKKLSPCVVFIDEADAIFCSRTGASSRTSHRELINQFLREWDGMNDLSAFIMVATNRPFDLDDAVLRRLPRRLLVDLPTEQDRLAILKIHLKKEQLDPAVDLVELSKRTELYSGSDLKNLSVAAALACVREENDAATKHQGDEPYEYPARRILTPTHFERGMEEIGASINEDMSSLGAIRKFDEQYGDRRGRKPKSKGWGFGPAPDGPTTESVRVRN